MTIRAHIFTNIEPVLFLKQIPEFESCIEGVLFSFGMDVPNDIDVLIVYTRASYSIQTPLPQCRTAFFAGEPDVIHPFSTRFLNQFGIVLTTSDKRLTTRKLRENYCSMPFVGINFTDMDHPLNLTYFENLECPVKNDKISIVTSNKSHTEFHNKRLTFLDFVKEKIPDHIELYGRGFKSIDDKKDALLDHKYHISLENGGGDHTWTEKLTDPLLCWTYPFYHGCENLEDDIPAKAFEYINIDNPDQVINQMMAAVKNNTWEKNKDSIAEARRVLFSDFNIMKKFASLAKQLMALEPENRAETNLRLIRSERSFWPEAGCRGSIPETIVRSTLLFFDPKIELRASNLQKKIEARRSKKRAQKIAALEASKKR
ncbi:MAG: hypothetical protein COB84_00335 [Rhodobacteraceae bacterium]|nr:MAG: hypothetical protein COB84_00335 [Paracoccaceae bacterium]